MKDIITYNEYLLALLSNMREHNAFYDELKVNTYLTLLALNNGNYQSTFFTNEIAMIEDFLRKVNNLKVKLQLHRKQEEIESLIETIKKIYDENQKTIEKYNKGTIKIEETLSSQNTVELTQLIDLLTKEKMRRIALNERITGSREQISTNILNSKYTIQNETIYIDVPNSEQISISLDEFYEMYEYLLNVNNYKTPFLNANANNQHEVLVLSIINSLNELQHNNLIPIILTSLLNENIPNYELIDTSAFKIDNIKITELYALAEKKSSILNPNTAKWQQIKIPNEYLYQKIKEIIKKGMYYFNDNSVVFENIIASNSDFKVSISIENIIKFLETNLSCIINASTTI